MYNVEGSFSLWDFSYATTGNANTLLYFKAYWETFLCIFLMPKWKVFVHYPPTFFLHTYIAKKGGNINSKKYLFQNSSENFVGIMTKTVLFKVDNFVIGWSQ